jgi:hypothetical protein
MQVGVFIPVGSNGWLISTTQPRRTTSCSGPAQPRR